MKLVAYILAVILLSCSQGTTQRMSADSGGGNSPGAEPGEGNEDGKVKPSHPDDRNGVDLEDVWQEGEGYDLGPVPDNIGMDSPSTIAYKRLGRSQKFFNDTIQPLFETQCRDCHKAPKLSPPAGATEDIYQFNYGYTQMSEPGGALGARMMRKLMGYAPHEGGDICKKSLQVEPCGSLAEWWQVSFGHEGEPVGDRRLIITNVSPGGIVTGYAKLEDNPDFKPEIMIKAGDKLLTYTYAELEGNKFRYQLPDEMRDGSKQQISVFAAMQESSVELLNSPYEFVAYQAKGEGDAFKAVKDKVACEGCHSGPDLVYDDYYDKLATPPPSEGGSATFNYLYQLAAGRLSHPKLCEDCGVISNWWLAEFE